MIRFPMRALLIPAFILTLAAQAPPTLRLPDAARPRHYAVDVSLDPDQETFQGHVTIQLTVLKPGATLWLHGTDLAVKAATFTRPGHAPLTAKAHLEGSQFLGLTFEKALIPGPGTLTLTYEGKVSRRDTMGIFAEKEGDAWYAFTQFEADGARRAFPCFDEPGYKVPWQLTLRVPKAHMAVANTPILRERVEGGTKIVTFQESKPLPSYLVAFAVGTFDVVEAGPAGKKRTPLRILVPKGHAGEAVAAAKAIPALLDRLEAYFGIPYPYEKLDSLVIPETSNFGAMENPGLITYARNVMLAKPEAQTLWFERNMLNTTAHEMAHQWFGDLVTMQWWNDLWLNEGFATWMSAKIVNAYKPQWNWKIEESLGNLRTAMGADSLATSRKIRQPITTQDDIANAFDGITYQKGASILDMFEARMGEKAFRRGVRAYLRAHAHGNATTGDFLKALAKEGGTWIAPAFSTFLDETGVPEVALELVADKTGKGSILRATQRRFVPLGSKASVDRIWKIPFSARYAIGGKVHHLKANFETASAEFRIAAPPNQVDYLTANEGMTGYYRVSYSPELLDRLLSHEATALTRVERVGLIQELAILAHEGRMPLDRALALLPRSAQEQDPYLFGAALEIAWLATGYLVPDERIPQTKQLLRSTYGARARAMGLRTQPGEPDGQRQLRQTLGGLAGYAEDPEVLAQARQIALQWLEDRSAVDLETANLALPLAAMKGDQALFDRCLAALKATQDAREKSLLFSTLGSFEDPALAAKAQMLVLSPEFDPRQSIAILYTQGYDRATVELAYGFMKAHVDELLAKLPQESGSSLITLGNAFSDIAHRNDLEAFFKPRITTIPGGPRTLDQILEGIDLRRTHLEILQPKVLVFLNAQQGR